MLFMYLHLLVSVLLLGVNPSRNFVKALIQNGESNLLYEFSECINNTRSMFYYADSNEPITCRDSPNLVVLPPVKGLRCDLVCERGYFLGVDLSGEKPVSSCEKCPKGKYSLGGGKLYSKRTNAWTNPLPIDIRTDCVTRNLFSGEWQQNCAPWNATEDGLYVASGYNSKVLERYEASRLFSTLKMSATYVRDGSITFKFRVDSEPPFDGLVFQIDDKSVTDLIYHTDGWEELTFDVKAGTHEFAWDYTKDFNGDAGIDQAQVQVIELVGTSYSDTNCHPCGSDTTLSGGSLCAFCEANEYAAPISDSELDFTCYPCPSDTFSPQGSIGLDACTARRPCDENDLIKVYSSCSSATKTRDISYAWSDPMTCDLSLSESITLPETERDVSCDPCEHGFFLNANNECQTCGDGQLMNGAGDCESCPRGKVVVSELNYGAHTADGWKEWPSIFDSDLTKQSGWKLTQRALVFAPTATGQKKQATSFPIQFSVDFVHSGFLKLSYQLANLPTFESTGGRMWLELEILDNNELKEVDNDDDNERNKEIVHLRNGGENGTFHESVPVDIINPSNKLFRIVLRVTTPGIERFADVKIFGITLHGTKEGFSASCEACDKGYRVVYNSENPTFGVCEICPAGTYVQHKGDGAHCTQCPKNWFSRPGSVSCQRCGTNTYSEVGATACSPKSTLYIDSPVNGQVKYVLPIQYNLSLIQSLITPDINDSSLISHEATDMLLSLDGVPRPGKYVSVTNTFSIITGIFHRVQEEDWNVVVNGQIMDEEIDWEGGLPYLIRLKLVNPKDVGTFFTQQTGRYGAVQCAAPAEWITSNGGTTISIDGMNDGSGINVSFSGGSPCVSELDEQFASTQIHFVCDLNVEPTGVISLLSSDTKQSPSHDESININKCDLKVEWRTPYACPICEKSYFQEIRTTCSGGEQSIHYNKRAPCYGGDQPEGIPIATCSVVVLDEQSLYKVYAVITVIGVVMLVLMICLLVVHRKYRTTYEDFMYLKGKMPKTVEKNDDGAKESTFEFSPHETAMDINDTPVPQNLDESPHRDTNTDEEVGKKAPRYFFAEDHTKRVSKRKSDVGDD